MCSSPSGTLSPVCETEAQRHLVGCADLPAHPARGAVLNINTRFWQFRLKSGCLDFTGLLFIQMNARSLSDETIKSWKLVLSGLCLVKGCKCCFWFFQKRACKPVETIPKEADAFLIGCAMELDSKQKISADWGPWATKTKQNSMVCLHCQRRLFFSRTHLKCVSFCNKITRNCPPFFHDGFVCVFVG